MKERTENPQNQDQQRHQKDPREKNNNSGRFEKGSERAREAGRKGGRNS